MGEDADRGIDSRREARLRREAASMGLALRKSRTRDTNRMDYGCYCIVDVANDYVVAGRFPYGHSLSLDAVEDVLEELLESREHEAFRKRAMPGHGCAGSFDPKWER